MPDAPSIRPFGVPGSTTCLTCGAEIPPGVSQCIRCLIELAVGVIPSPVLDPGVPSEAVLSSAQDDLATREFAHSQPGQKIGRYKLLQQIGEGGCGVVYMAAQEEDLRRLVALKVIKLGMDTKQVIARFEAERQALALMDHPNIARVLDAGVTESGRPFFVMELVKGVPVIRYCDESRLDTRQRLRIFVQICHAVQHAHQKGIIHRDLKPSNILVADHDGVPVPKVIDFGIAKATSGQMLTDKTVFTALEQFLGTPAYMSPEQAKLSGLDIDTRTDIYSLGVLLYELLTGKTPFDAALFVRAGLDEIRRIIREEEPPRPSTRLSTLEALEQRNVASQRQCEPPKLVGLVHGDLDWIVMKSLEKDRNRRYETAHAFARDIQRHLDQEPVFARPPSSLYRFQRFVRRHSVIFASASAVACALIVGLGFAIWALGQEKAALRRAIAAEKAQARLREQEAILRGEAQAAQRKAENSEIETRTVLDFFQTNVLGAARPKGLEGGLGPQVTVRQALDLAEPRMAGSFINRPLLEASVREGLAGTYYYLRDYAKATKQHEQVLSLRKAILGPRAEATETAMHNLLRDFLAGGRFHDALPLAEEVLKITQARPGPDVPATIAALNSLAAARLGAGQASEALPLLDQALRLQRARLGTEHPLTIEAMCNLADADKQAGLPNEALHLYAKAFELSGTNPDSDQPNSLRVMDKLASILWQLGRAPEAKRVSTTARMLRQRMAGKSQFSMMEVEAAHADVTHLEMVVETNRARFGPHEADTLRAMNNLAIAYRKARSFSHAVTLQTETLRLQRATLGPNDRETLWSIDSLGRAHLAAGNVSDAVRILEEGLGLWRASFGLDDWDTLAAMQLLAGAYIQAGQPTNAEVLYRDGLDRFRSQAPWLTAGALDGLGECLIRQGKYAEAEESLRESLAIRQRERPNEWPVFRTQSLLGAALMGQAHYAESEPLLLEGFEGLSKRVSEIPNFRPGILERAGDRLVELYTKWGNQEKAAEWKQKIAKLDTAPVGAPTPQ
ncbi:MAG: serine/threonine protein kinase [Verrucomicrobia bacterium]|nr:MAG: serine/threonine protein kinase [Verrucomicrobiota bacterium]